MKKTLSLILLVLLMAACTGAPTPVVVVPTLASLPSNTPAPNNSVVDTAVPSPELSSTPLPTQTATEIPTQATTPTPSATPIPTDTSVPTDTGTPPPSPTNTLTPSPTATVTPSPTVTFTYTPSLTITNTITPLPSPTFTPSQELDSLGILAMLSERATILPPATLYNPPTLTAIAFAAQTLVAGGAALTAAPVEGAPALPTLPSTNLNCATQPPAALSVDPTLTQSLGCPVGSLVTTSTAVQSFERGTMIYVQGSPGSIYALALDGRFRRFDDTWTSGEPETGGETPPLGLIEPKRGFGKVWRLNLDVRGSLGWAVTDEQGATTSVQLFEHGRAVFLPQRGETYVLIDDPGGLTGSWRTLPGGF